MVKRCRRPVNNKQLRDESYILTIETKCYAQVGQAKRQEIYSKGIIKAYLRRDS